MSRKIRNISNNKPINITNQNDRAFTGGSMITPEPFVDADAVAAFICEPLKNVGKLTRAGKLTAYPLSGHVRRTYKYRLSEVAADITKLRRPSVTPASESMKTKN